MTRETKHLPLSGSTAGTARTLTVHRYGAAGARPKAYIQASLHADETPAMMMAHHLVPLLDAAAAEGAITGEVVLLPYANPIGLSQFVNATHLGRYEMGGGGNFNRNWPDLAALVADKVEGRLTHDPESNVRIIREAMAEALAWQEPRGELAALRMQLARLAHDADIVLDCHCDDDALMHLFLIPAHWPDGQDLASELGCRAVLLAEDSGGASFDEAFSTPWTRLAERFPGHPIPPACFAGTVELRGGADVSDELGTRDAQAVFRFLQRRGVIAGDPGALPAPQCEATRLDATDSVRSPAPGILAYKVSPGDHVQKDQVLAEVIDPSAEPGQARTPVASGTDGLVLSCRAYRFVQPGMTVAKVVGTHSLDHRSGYLLED